jgi:mRNA interferase MazF
MTCKRGTIVLVRFPFSSGTNAKVRPALVVQIDRNNRRLRNTILAMITSSTGRAGREPTQLLIDIATPDGQESGLLHTSVVKCENLFTVEQQLIFRVIGSLPSVTMKKIDVCLQMALGMK